MGAQAGGLGVRRRRAGVVAASRAPARGERADRAEGGVKMLPGVDCICRSDFRRM